MARAQTRFAGETLKSQLIPKSVIQTIRDEQDWTLQVRKYVKNEQNEWQLDSTDVTLPLDLQGYVFAVGALFQSADRPEEKGTPLYTGDGMIYRLGFEQGKATLKTRITKTPCYYADLATAGSSTLTTWTPQTTFTKNHRLFSRFASFRNGGPSRFSILLGGRNQLNTAFLKVRDEVSRDRLWVTIDAGRPYEVDTGTLELLTPVGTTQEWIGILPIVSWLTTQATGSYPFDVYINSAHPVTDPAVAGELFTTNYSTGYNGVYRKPVNWALEKLNQLFCDNLDEKPFGQYTDLIHYQVEAKEMKRWRLFLEDESAASKSKPVQVEQSLHQLAITEDFIIMADIAFRMEFSQIFSPFLFGFLKLKQLQHFPFLGSWIYSVFLRDVSPLPYGILYLVKRSNLITKSGGTRAQPTPLFVKKVILPREISHFTADYSNPNGKITVHVGHSNGSDVTKWLTQYDRAVPNRPPFRRDLEGMMTGTTDLGALGKYVIDGETGKIEAAQLIHDSRCTWSLPVYTHHDLSPSASDVKALYWIGWGFSWELIPEQLYQTYRSRDRRVIIADNLPNENQPLALLRLDTQHMTIVDVFEFPPGYFVCTPQFVPSQASLPDGVDPTAHGYIACIVLSDGTNGEPTDEFWVFHADDFSKPIYRLDVPDSNLNLALTLHSTWLKEIHSPPEAERQQQRQNSVHQDYKPLLEKAWKATQKLFNSVVYDYFTQQISEKLAEEQLKKSEYQISVDKQD